MASNMLRIEKTSTEEPHIVANYTLEILNRPKTSMLYHVLPAMVQSRMPTLSSIRHSISDFRTRASHKKQDSTTDMSLPTTPPPVYSSRPESGTTTPCRPSSSAGASLLDFGDIFAERSTPSIPVPPAAAYETSTGINWLHAKYGMMVLNQAHQHSSAPFIKNDEIMVDMIRSQYVQSIALFLRSLPSELTPVEQLSLLAAMPQNMLNTHGSIRRQTLTHNAEAEFPTQGTPSSTVLRRATAWLVFKLFILVQILLPYIRQFLKDAAQFEEEHQITRRMFNTSVTVGSGLSRECWKVTQAICQMNNGVVGEALSSVTVYCAEGVAGGIQQGIADALRLQQMKSQQRKKASTIREPEYH
ncbi:hypothetical protein GQ44DRAFT_699931 [Phaeosphaeriaceae sp. PMI808]|nr:hypothetical protein GQ44DRAFT_699931 [Phaeosphaeriaceae sp. PMI808]